MSTSELNTHWRSSRECYLAICSRALADSPDERLRLYRHACDMSAQVTAGPVKISASQDRRLWAEILIKGSQDPWSAVRNVSVKGLLKLLVCHLREVSSGNQACDPTSYGTLPADSSYNATPEATALVCLLLRRWSAAKEWYQKEGLLCVWRGMADYLLSNEQVAWMVLHRVALHALKDPQLPVREGAAELTVSLALPLSPRSLYILDHIVTTLRNAEIPDAIISVADEVATHAVEGHLLALLRLIRSGAAEQLLTGHLVLGVFFRLASHPASSVRQYIAEILGPRNDRLFECLLVHMAEEHKAAQSDAAQWQRLETVMMALHRHLDWYLVQPPGYHPCFFSADSSRSSPIASPHLLGNCVFALLAAAVSDVFEVSRMGRQVMPLLIQFWVRYSATVRDVFDICLLGRRDRCVNLRANEFYGEMVLPCLWWFAAIRHATDVTAREDIQQIVRRHANVERLGLDALTLTCVAPVAVVIATFYSFCHHDPEMQALALREETWRSIMEKKRTYIRFGPNFVAAMQRNGVGVQHLVPVWALALRNLMTHEQCMVLCMIRLAVTGAQPKGEEVCPFVFAYRSTFAAPAVQEGGEDIPLGYTWLRVYFPSESDASSLHVRYRSPSSPGVVSIPMKVDAMVAQSIVQHVFQDLYVSPGTEPAVLHEIRSLMRSCWGDEQRINGDTGWGFVILRAVISRLDAVAASWPSASAGAATTLSKSDESDWDDDNGEAVHGISVEEEVADAKNMALQLSDSLFSSPAELIGFVRSKEAELGKRVSVLLVGE